MSAQLPPPPQQLNITIPGMATIPAHNSNTALIVITAAMLVLAIATVMTIIVIRPAADNTILITAILGFFTTTTAAVLGLVKSNENSTNISDLHVVVNSRLTELLAQTAAAAKLAGQIDAEGVARLAADAASREASAATAAAAALAMQTVAGLKNKSLDQAATKVEVVNRFDKPVPTVVTDASKPDSK